MRSPSFQALGWHKGPRKGLKRAPRSSLFKVRDDFLPTPDRLNGMSLFIFFPALLPWFYSRTVRSGFILWEKWYFQKWYSQRVLEKKIKTKAVVKRISSMKYFKKLSQTWWESFYIKWDHSNKADEKLPTSRQVIVKFQNTGDRKKRFKRKILFSGKENRDQNGFLFLNSNFFFFLGNGAIFSKF